MTELFAAHSAQVLKGLAHELGCDIDALASEATTVVELPAGAKPGAVALAACTGLGTIVSVHPALVGWARENAPKDKHFRALQPFFLADLAIEAMKVGLATKATAHGHSVCFALNELQAQPALPQGLRLERVGREWMDRYRPTSVFDNAIGEPDETGLIERLEGAVAVLDAAGEPTAVAGWRDDFHGYREIGVDVKRDSRGLGLGKLVTIAATRGLADVGQTPFYSCGSTNIRSHRNAIACGFLPVYIIGMVYAKSDSGRLLVAP